MEQASRLPHHRWQRAGLLVLPAIVSFAAFCPAQKIPSPASAPIPPSQQIPIDASAQVVSETYLGMLTCSDCGGTRIEITLYWEGHDGRTPIAYHMTETAIGAEGRAPIERAGFFTEQVLQNSTQSTGGPLGGTLIQLKTGEPVFESFLRVAENNGELLLLDENLHVLPENVPRSLGRVTGEQQHGLTLLTDRDDGLTISMRGGEVFLVVLPLGDSGYQWSADYPAAMALLEPASEVELKVDDARAAANVPAAPPAAPSSSSSTSAPRRPRRGRVPMPSPPIVPYRAPTYQAWQMVAPPEQTEPVERTLIFKLQRPDAKKPLTSRIVTFHIVVP